MMESERKNRLRAIALRAIALFLVIATVSVAVVEFVSRNQIADRLDTVRQSSTQVLSLQHEIIHSQLGAVSSDLLFLANQNELHSYVEEGKRVYLKAIAREYLEMARQKAIYNQIRFLDDYGMEIVRIDFNDGHPIIVPDHLLQPKGGRYYFVQTIALDDGEVFVSQFDLNMEQGVVEEPRRPVIRFATPIRSLANGDGGIVILNYLGESLFQALGQAVEGTNQRTFLANWESYWLWGPDPSVEWGFMYYGTGVHTVDTSFSGAWEKMASTHQGQFRTADGLFSFVTIRPIAEMTQASVADVSDIEQPNQEGVWKLISFVPASVLATIETPVRRLWRLVQALVVALAAGVSWFYTRFRVLRSEHRAQIEFLAKYDSLTGACNRHYFEQSIADEEARARRYRHSISFLMIDITRFKQINDTHGHQIGDQVLQEVAGVLKGSVRETDVVVRYGGDEFLVMFPESEGEADAAKERIQNAMHRLNTEAPRFAFPIMLALGSAHWESTSGEAIEDALSHADENMYLHKQLQHRKLAQS